MFVSLPFLNNGAIIINIILIENSLAFSSLTVVLHKTETFEIELCENKKIIHGLIV